MPFKILFIAGARPNFMKLAPLFRVLPDHPAIDPVLVHTGQHYDDAMSGRFFRDLGLPTPAHNLEVGSASHAQQTAEVMKRFEPVLQDERASAVLVVGDVNSTVACALVASKLNVPVIHVEAGLRSFDRSMPEEINRRVTDAIAELLLVSEESGIANLRAEGVEASHIRFVGNLMIDSLHYALREKRDPPDGIPRDGRFGLVTLHRPANVDDPERFAEILSALNEIGRELPLYFPVHPRTRSRIAEIETDHIRFLDPLGYLQFVSTMARSALVLTDSGGIQEETTALGIPCLTIRENTERPITVSEGTNRLAGVRRDTILSAWSETQRDPKQGRRPRYWDGNTAQRCIQAIEAYFNFAA